jgi:two-component system, chemotaxis family, chemotaxis protein CheY
VTRTALIVDDSPSMRAMVAHTLEVAGFQVLQGEDGQQAAQLLDGRHIDVIVTDLNMPIMDGIQFILHVRSMPGYKFVPVLMLTTESQESRKLEGKKAGATGWLVKPFNPEQLVAVIGKVIR